MEFFTSVILLLSDLCLDKNEYAIKSLEKLFSFEAIYYIIN